MFMNYMDYVNDASMYMFTNGQNTRIQSLFATGGSRVSLLSSLGCVPVSNSPTALFTGTPTTICPGGSVAFTSQSTGAPTSYSWTFTGGTPATSTAAAPTVVYNTPGTYAVSLTVNNSFGTNTLTKTAYINVVTASALPVVEGFESTTFPPTNWTIGNPDNLTAWVRTTSASGFGTSTASAYFDNYTSNYTGQKDYIYTPSYDFTNVTNGRLKWDYAYTYYQTSYDSLQIMYSIDCGATWVNLWKKGGVSLATATGITAKFVPTASQWKRDSVSLTALLGKNNVKFAFINITKYGNSLLLDNINIFDAITTCNKPVADFTAAPTTVTVGNSVAFTDLSTNTPTTWAWTFAGGTPASSTAQNPSVTYNSVGTYNVTLTATNACGSSTAVTKTSYITVVNGSTGTPPVAGFRANKTSLCAGGAVSFTDTSKNTPTSWAWTFAGGTPSASSLQSPTVTYSTAGTYAVKLVVFNSGGKDSITKSGYISVNANPTASATTFAVSCFGGNTGSATAAGAGGTPSYAYLWSNGDATASIINKSAGSYTVTVTDSKSCSATAIANIAQPFSALGITMSQTNAYCGQNNGTVTANATGGSGGFSYTWAGSAATTQTINGLSPNTYSVTVTDQKGCTVQGSTTVSTDPNTLTVNVNSTDASCGQNNGSAVAIPSGSSIGATYLWSNGQTTSSASGLSVGSYQVTVTNASGCTASSSAVIGNSSGPSVSVSSFNATCNALNNGSAIASVSSTGNYTISWSNGQTGASATNLLAGTYYVTVTESGCQTVDTFSISEPTALTASASVVNTAVGSTNGYAAVTASGGTQPYSYSWNTGATTSSISGLAIGSYSCTVFDASNCSVVVSADIIPNGINNIDELSSVSIHPNPAIDILQVEFKFSSPIEFSFAITDEIGRVINAYEKAKAANYSSKIDVCTLVSGIYYIQLKTNNGKKTYKFIKQ
jgi:PKD repeat protein